MKLKLNPDQTPTKRFVLKICTCIPVSVRDGVSFDLWPQWRALRSDGGTSTQKDSYLADGTEAMQARQQASIFYSRMSLKPEFTAGQPTLKQSSKREVEKCVLPHRLCNREFWFVWHLCYKKIQIMPFHPPPSCQRSSETSRRCNKVKCRECTGG